MDMKTPVEVINEISEGGRRKNDYTLRNLIVLGMMGGAFIAFAGISSTMAVSNLLQDSNYYGISRLIMGMIFPAGLVMVLLSGAELFTGNSLMVISLLKKKISFSAMLKNWITVYLANFAGALLVVAIIAYSGLFEVGGGNFGKVSMSIASAKLNIGFVRAVILGIGCNWLVCMAIWFANSVKSVPGKIMSVIVPISTFVIIGFEHSVANMYYIPAGIAADSIMGANAAADLNAAAFLTDNLLPVTIGNMIGGMVFVGITYYLIYGKESE